MLRGNHPAKIDDKGRLKLPSAFRAFVQQQHGPDLFITSLTGESVRIYPMAVWLALEERLAKMATTHPARLRFLDRVNYYGQSDAFDGQGRVVIPARLRDEAGIVGDVAVIGKLEYLDVWNQDRFVAKLKSDPYTDDDARALAEVGV